MNKKLGNISGLALKIGIALLILLISTLVTLRWDLSKDRAYSLNKNSKELMRSLDDVMLVKIISSKELPVELNNLNRYTADLLREYQLSSRGKLRFEYVKPPTQEELFNLARSSGLRRVRFQGYEGDQMTLKEVIFGVVFEYQGRIESFDLIPRIEPRLEYEMTLRMQSLIQKSMPKVLAFADTTYYYQRKETFARSLQMNYILDMIDLKDPLPDADALLFNGVVTDLETEQLYQLDQFLMRGGKLIFLQDKTHTDGHTLSPIQSNIFDLLEHYGFELSDDIALDINCDQQSVGVGTYLYYPMYPILKGSAHPVSRGLHNIIFYLANGIRFTRPDMVEFQPILTTSEFSDVMPAPTYQVSQEMFTGADPMNYTMGPIVLAAETKGEFESFFAHNDSLSTRPGFIAKSPMTSVILFSDKELVMDSDKKEFAERGNVVLNAIDYSIGRDSMMKIRNRHLSTPVLSTRYFVQKNFSIWRDLNKTEQFVKTSVKVIFTLLPSIILVLIALFIAFKRKIKLRIMTDEKE